MYTTLLTISLTLFTLLTVSSSPFSFAAEAPCQPIYGGGQTCVTQGVLRINKQVERPQGKELTDNLLSNDEKFAPDTLVTFKLSVTNTGSNQLTNVVIKDILPPHLISVSGGSYDQATRTVTANVGTLHANETKEVTMTAKTAPVNELPGESVTCLVNQAVATADNKNEDRDNTQFCITKPGQPTTTTTPQQPTTGGLTQTKGGQLVQPVTGIKSSPNTGPEAFALIALLPSALVGVYLRRKSA